MDLRTSFFRQFKAKTTVDFTMAFQSRRKRGTGERGGDNRSSKFWQELKQNFLLQKALNYYPPSEFQALLGPKCRKNVIFFMLKSEQNIQKMTRWVKSSWKLLQFSFENHQSSKAYNLIIYI